MLDSRELAQFRLAPRILHKLLENASKRVTSQLKRLKVQPISKTGGVIYLGQCLQWAYDRACGQAERASAC